MTSHHVTRPKQPSHEGIAEHPAGNEVYDGHGERRTLDMLNVVEAWLSHAYRNRLSLSSNSRKMFPQLTDTAMASTKLDGPGPSPDQEHGLSLNDHGGFTVRQGYAVRSRSSNFEGFSHWVRDALEPDLPAHPYFIHSFSLYSRKPLYCFQPSGF
jgi:hypothetical protein